MKRQKIQRTFAFIALSICALTSALATFALQQDDAESANATKLISPGIIEAPKSLDELLADPNFKIAPDASNEEVASAAYELYRKYDRFASQETDKFYQKLFRAAPEKKAEIKANIGKELKNIADAFYKKVESDVMPQLRKTVADDEFAPMKEKHALDALYLILLTLNNDKNNDEIEKIRERELERYRKAQKSNDDAKNVAFGRLNLVDRYYLGLPSLPFWNQFDLDFEIKNQDPPKLRAALVEWGDKLAEELKRDPVLIENCDFFYVLTLRDVDEDLALEYREKFREGIGREEAAEIYTKIHGHKVRAEDVAIYRDDSLDESILDVPENKPREFYLDLREKIQRAQMQVASAPLRKEVREEYKRKANDALAKIELNLASPADRNRIEVRNLENATFSAETILALKEKIAVESAKPLDQANLPFLSVARAVVSKFELLEAVKSGDRDAALKACDAFAAQAEFSADAARILVQTLEDLARTNKTVALALVDATLEKAKASNGSLGENTLRLLKIASNK